MQYISTEDTSKYRHMIDNVQSSDRSYQQLLIKGALFVIFGQR